MKGIDIFCASPASTAICVSIDHKSMVRHGGRALDRHNPHIYDTRRTKLFNSTPLPAKPKPHHHRTRKGLSNEVHTQKPKKSTELASPPGSSRYLLSDTSFLDFDMLNDFDPVPQLVPIKTKETQVQKSKESTVSKPSISQSHNQVVVLRVSLHCKGCEGKVRKHISRMEGVSSFSIDFATKKVTVIGKVSPFGVLESISRVKNARFWSPPSPTSIPGSDSSPDK